MFKNQYLEKLIDSGLPVVFDYDGVLFEVRWHKDRINMPNETDEKLLEEHKAGKNLYTTPIRSIQDFINSLNNRLFVLSHMHNEIEFNFKKSQIGIHYPKIPVENVICAFSTEDKKKHLKKIIDEFGEIVFINDALETLIFIENELYERCHCFHVSSLYVDQDDGIWIFKKSSEESSEYDFPVCSICGFHSNDTYRYCPDCGKRMIKKETDTHHSYVLIP